MPGTRPVKSIGGLLHPGPGHDYGRQGRAPWLDVDWQAAQHRTEIDGREVNYCELGEGPAVVFVHGLGASWQSWLENMPDLARDHRVVAVDLPGFGYSEMPREDISIERYASWTCRLMDRLGIDSAAVVGNSMGGFVGADLAIRYPQRVQRLVVVSAAIFWQTYRRAQPLLRLARLGDAAATRALTRATDDIATRHRLRIWALASAGFRYPHLISPELGHEMVRSARHTDGFLPALEALADYPLEEQLPRIRCPTLIVWGAHDTLVPVKDAKRLQELIPGARREVFERTGHVAMLERPERFNRLLREFLDEPTSNEARPPDPYSRVAPPASG
ncbi:MAG TPA: alpha/beta hydrolase [Solirubrobacteraceae bacterium]|nr:alpha/beta hydrolase [Solirubrobacteraceae bacterium]